MPLWGTNPTDESRPKWLREEDLPANNLNTAFADERGWVIRHANGFEEVIACVSNLSTTLSGANIVGAYFGAKTYSTSSAGTVVVVFNEKVTVTSGATLDVTASGTWGTETVTATAAGQTGVQQAVFGFTTPVSGSTLTLAAQTINGTVVDAGTVLASDLEIESTDIQGASGKGTVKTATVA